MWRRSTSRTHGPDSPVLSRTEPSLNAGSRLAQQQVTLRNEGLKCFVRPPGVWVHFGCEAAECALDIGAREPWMQSESYCGCLQIHPKILANSPGQRLKEQDLLPRSRVRRFFSWRCQGSGALLSDSYCESDRRRSLVREVSISALG